MGITKATDGIPNGLLIGGILAAVLSSWKLLIWTTSFFKTRSFHAVRKQKKLDIFQINANWAHQVLNQISLEEAEKIVNLSFDQLQKALQSGDISATKALHAYQYKAAKENESCNFICEPIMEAEKMAAELDSLSREERKTKLLFGIPISLKESYPLEGYDNTMGCVKYANKPSKRTSTIAQMLVAHGAVPFIRTNVPQTMMSFDSTNPIYGVTSNPHDSTRSCGGSSGGEGSAIAACSSILGFGSDIGGSLRIPAAFCGIYTLKPTAGRLSLLGDVGVDGNERIVTATCGPMGRDVNSLVDAMRTLSTTQSYFFDPSVPPITFNEEELTSTKRLRIGYFSSVQPIEISESCRKAVDMAVNALQRSGHEVVEWAPPDFVWGISVAFATNLFADGGITLVKSVENDILEGHIKELVYLTYIPVWFKKFVYYTIGRLFFPQYILNNLKASCGSGSVAKFWEHEAEIKGYQRKVVQELRQQGIDAIICPAMPIPAMRIGECKDAVGAVSYMGIFNLLNFPSGVVPVSKVTSDDVQKDMESYPAKDIWHKAMKMNLQGSEGLPMAVQCASLPFHEERCLRVMKELETVIGYNVLCEYRASDL